MPLLMAEVARDLSRVCCRFGVAGGGTSCHGKLQSGAGMSLGRLESSLESFARTFAFAHALAALVALAAPFAVLALALALATAFPFHW